MYSKLFGSFHSRSASNTSTDDWETNGSQIYLAHWRPNQNSIGWMNKSRYRCCHRMVWACPCEDALIKYIWRKNLQNTHASTHTHPHVPLTLHSPVHRNPDTPTYPGRQRHSYVPFRFTQSALMSHWFVPPLGLHSLMSEKYSRHELAFNLQNY